jgi:ribose transport system ATP-binding protein
MEPIFADNRKQLPGRGTSPAVPGPDNGGSAVVIKGLSKRFGATQALQDVSLNIGAGQVRGLIGENGAGKSTLLKILSGLVAPDSGEMTMFGQSYKAKSSLDAHRIGIQTAFQELTQVEDLSVTQNLLLPYEPRGAFGMVSRSKSREQAERILATFGISSIDPDTEIRDLSLSDRQKIEIVRSAGRSPQLLLLDEATSALSAKDVEWLYGLVRNLSAQGVIVTFISHRISEIRDLCDTISILRNGKHIATELTASVSNAEIVRLVIGRSLGSAFPPRPPKPAEGSQAVALAAMDLRVGTSLNGASLTLRRGHILGLAALDGMGQKELFSALFGAAPLDRGEIRVGEREVVLSTPLDAIRAGIGYVPSDRRREGVLVRQSGALNMSLPVLNDYSQFGIIDWGRLQRAITLYLAKLSIHPRALYRQAGSFSGGNQQKIVIAKWLMAGPPVLLMNDPTRGVDVGTKFEIFTIMREFADAGGAILFHSTELNELVNMCDEVHVMYKGRVLENFGHDRLSEEGLMQSMLGEGSDESDRQH